MAISPELNVFNFGETVEDVKESIREAIELFIDQCREMGTLDELQYFTGLHLGRNTHL